MDQDWLFMGGDPLWKFQRSLLSTLAITHHQTLMFSIHKHKETENFGLKTEDMKFSLLVLTMTNP